MSIKAVLFDLDGTLLPLNQDEFVKHYFKGLSTKMAQNGYELKQLIDSIWAGIRAMHSQPDKINEDSFWDCLCSVYGKKIKDDIPIFEEYYQNDFDKISAICGFNEKANLTVKMLKSKGIKIILATNPVFPAIATKKRMLWAGLDPQDFSLITTYENSKDIKPSLNYYNEILQNFSLLPEECIMVGNDVDEDMAAENLGLKVFLLTDCLINKNAKDISRYEKGDFDQLNLFLMQNI